MASILLRVMSIYKPTHRDKDSVREEKRKIAKSLQTLAKSNLLVAISTSFHLNEFPKGEQKKISTLQYLH